AVCSLQFFKEPMRTLALFTACCLGATAAPKPEDTWPGFRGREMSGIATANTVPERWSATDHVKWAVPIAGHGWSSPIVWGDTILLTSAISSGTFKNPTPGLYGNEYIAEMQAQGVSDDEIGKRAQARDNEMAGEAHALRFLVYALGARTTISPATPSRAASWCTRWTRGPARRNGRAKRRSRRRSAAVTARTPMR